MCERVQGSCRLYCIILGVMLMVSGVYEMATRSAVVGACILLGGASILGPVWCCRPGDYPPTEARSLLDVTAPPQNQLSGVTDPRQRRGSQYRDLHIDIPPPSDFFVQESPPPSYEASSHSKPVVTPPPTYSAAVDLSGRPPVWDVPAAATATTQQQQRGSSAEDPRHSSGGCD